MAPSSKDVADNGVAINGNEFQVGYSSAQTPGVENDLHLLLAVMVWSREHLFDESENGVVVRRLRGAHGRLQGDKSWSGSILLCDSLGRAEHLVGDGL